MALQERVVGSGAIAGDSSAGQEAVSSPALASPRPSQPHWRRRFKAAAAGGDVAAGVIALATVLWFVSSSLPVAALGGVVMSFGWLMLLALGRCYDWDLFGEGVEEYRRVAVAGLGSVGVAGVFSAVSQVPWGRALVLGLLAATFATLVWRRFLRAVLHRRRARGAGMNRALLVGSPALAEELAATLSKSHYHGTRAVGALVPRGSEVPEDASIPAYICCEDIPAAAQQLAVDEVILVGNPDLDSTEMRDLMWELADRRIGLLISPVGLPVTVPRLTIRPAEGTPLLHVAQPQISGMGQSIKTGVDRVLSSLGLLLLAPVMAAIALAVRATSPGPALYRQTRVGANGEPFTMYKFRSMTDGADRQIIDLRDANQHGDPRLFKMKNDPRITQLGKFLRRYSLDELPQLFNVLKGDMSLVGPRPPLPNEVEHYTRHGWFRMAVRPGLTGLWQVSGRSDLDPDESLELDLRYVENWSFALDTGLLWKTGRAVLRGGGAY